MFRAVEDFRNTWQLEKKYTMSVLERLTDESLKFKSVAIPRGVARLAQHLVESNPAMFGAVGITVDGPEYGATPTSADEIVKGYDASADSALAAAKDWNDANMMDEVNFFGTKMPLGAYLMGVIAHQTHHRGQLTILMREAGVIPPNVYGPTVEEQKAMGREPMV
jgi:uncharacterized damage-inducible protein DinB